MKRVLVARFFIRLDLDSKLFHTTDCPLHKDRLAFLSTSGDSHRVIIVMITILHKGRTLMNQLQTPLFTALMNHHKKDPISFHVPGHKYGEIFPEIGDDYYQSLLKLDVTELTDLDDLHEADSVIANAQDLTADLYDAKQSFFLVNGSTVGNLAMILATCEENDVVLVQRNCHKSVIHGMQLAGVKPVFLTPEYDEEVKVPGAISFNLINRAINEYPEAKALILTNPNYYGMATDLTEIVKLAHVHAIPVLVDEAHGAHFTLGSPFPMSALKCGADIVIHSAHKTLPAMTMGSFLHSNSELIQTEKIQYFLQMLQSSSPSYPIMASLDLARYYLAQLKDKGIKAIIEKLNVFKSSLNEFQQFEVINSTSPMITTDPLKVTLQTRCSLSGYDLQSLFENEGIFVEMADPNNVLSVLPLGETWSYQKTIEKIKQAVRNVEVKGTQCQQSVYFEKNLITPLQISYKDVKKLESKVISFHDSVGKISAQMITPYPPGIPVIMAGELITKDHIDLMEHLMNTGARFHGAKMILKGKIEVF